MRDYLQRETGGYLETWSGIKDLRAKVPELDYVEVRFVEGVAREVLEWLARELRAIYLEDIYYFFAKVFKNAQVKRHYELGGIYSKTGAPAVYEFNDDDFLYDYTD